MAEEYASQWGFVKLLTGLATGVAGLLFYTAERKAYLPPTKWLLGVSALLFVGSIFLLMVCAKYLVEIDGFRESAAEQRRRNPSELGYGVEQYNKFVGVFQKFQKWLQAATVLFSLGLLAALVFFLWNVVR